MTFYEAALRVLEREGKPLHVSAIIDIAIRENLLSHVGKSPEEVMQSRLLAMARRRNDRKVVATALQTYALVDWGLPEDPAALEPVVEDRTALESPPLRPRERHPIPSPDKVRVAGRGERLRKSRREEEWEERRKRRKFPPLAEVAFEVLSQAGTAMAAVDLAAAARDRELVSEDLGTEALLNALREDNRRRSEAGRRPAFSISPAGEVTLEKSAAAEPSVELEAAVAYALGGPVAPEPRREERGPGAARLIAQAAEHRRHIQRLLRRRLGDLDIAGFEKAGLALLDQHGYREPRVARRSRDSVLLTVRKREGLTDLRYAVQLQRGGREVGREDLEALRREIGPQGAQMGLLLSPADASREVRQEASSPAQPVVVLLCGDALAEKYMEKRVGSTAVSVEVWDLDEDFFRRCRERPRDEERERRREREPDGERRRERHDPAAQLRDPAREAPGPSLPAPVPEAERASAAAALAERIIETPAQTPPPAAVDPAVEQRRREEAELRAAAHERIEAAELQARSRKLGQPG